MPDTYTTTDVRVQVGRFLMGQLSRRRLDEWLLPLVWSDAGTPEATDLAWSVELLLMEASGGYLSEDELRSALVPYAQFEVGKPAPIVVRYASSSSIIQYPTLAWPVGVLPAVASE